MEREYSCTCRRVSTSVKIAQGTTVVVTNTAEADDPDPSLLLDSPCDLHFRYARAYVRLSVSASVCSCVSV